MYCIGNDLKLIECDCHSYVLVVISQKAFVSYCRQMHIIFVLVGNLQIVFISYFSSIAILLTKILSDEC